MAPKVKIEIDPNAEEEVIIRCKSLSEEILSFQRAIEESSNDNDNTIELLLNDRKCFVSIKNILFFETEGGHTYAHTINNMYKTKFKLYELIDILPNNFMRISKSCVLNIKSVTSLKKSVTGVCEAYLKNSDKKVYISRMYYKPFREILAERYGK